MCNYYVINYEDNEYQISIWDIQSSKFIGLDSNGDTSAAWGNQTSLWTPWILKYEECSFSDFNLIS